MKTETKQQLKQALDMIDSATLKGTLGASANKAPTKAPTKQELRDRIAELERLYAKEHKTSTVWLSACKEVSKAHKVVVLTFYAVFAYATALTIWVVL